MKERVNPYEKAPGILNPMLGLAKYMSESTIENSLIDLIDFRISQINGCAYCLDMHSKDLRAAGETEQRLYVLDAWREAPFYSERERAALLWAEAINNYHDDRVPDEVYAEASTKLSEKELIDLAMAVNAINCFNRINIAFRVAAGTYQPSSQTKQAK